MATIIGDLAVRIGADTKGLTTGLARSKRQVRQLTDEAKAGGVELAKYAAAAAAAGAAIGAALVAESLTATRELGNLARIANTSASQFQKLAFGAKTVGIEQDKLSDIFKDMSDRVGDFLNTGGGPMADFFERIAPQVGVTAEQFRNLSGPQALQLYVDSLEKANLSQNEMTFFMEAIASDSTALIPLLKDGGAAMAALAQEADALGLALSDIQVQQVKTAAEELDRVKSVISGFVDQFTAQLAPVITALSRQFIEAAKDAGGVGEAASDAFGFVVDATGFVIDAVEGIRRTFELAGKGIAAFALGAGDAMLTVADFILNRPIQALNELIAALNEFAGTEFKPIGLSELGKSIQDQLEIVRRAQAIAIADIHETLMRPLPSAQFEQFVAEAQAASQAAAQAIQPVAANLQGTAGPSDEVFSDEAIRERLEKIREAHLSEAELLQLKFDEEHEILQEALARKQVTKAEFDQLDTEQRIAHETALNEISAQAAEERTRVAIEAEKRKMAAIGGAFKNLSTLMNSESRKQFEIGKAAALAGAIVDGYAAITGAYKVGASIGGPVVGAAFGATAAAATFQQINAIRGQSFGSGGGASGSVTGAVNDASTPVNVAGSAVQGQAASQQVVYLNGVDPGSFYDGRQIIDAANLAMENGAVLRVQGAPA